MPLSDATSECIVLHFEGVTPNHGCDYSQFIHIANFGYLYDNQ